VRDLGLKLREAATGPAWKVNAQAGTAFVEKLAASDAELAAEAANLLTREVRSAPTLVKYAQLNDYQIQTRAELAQAASEILKGLPIADAPVVDLVEYTESLEVEVASTLLYSASHYLTGRFAIWLPGCPRPAWLRLSSWACGIAASMTRRCAPFTRSSSAL